MGKTRRTVYIVLCVALGVASLVLMFKTGEPMRFAMSFCVALAMLLRLIFQKRLDRLLSDDSEKTHESENEN